MKRTFLLLMMICILEMLTVPCFAASIDEKGENAECSVTGYYQHVDEDVLFCNVVSGKAKIEFGNGTEILFDDIDSEAIRVAVRKITADDADAWEWFSSCMNNRCDRYYPIEVFFEDGKGERIISTHPANMTITCPNDISEPFVVNLLPSGYIFDRTFSLSDSIIKTSVPTNGYLIIAGQRNIIPSPMTGDNSFLGLWLTAAMCSGTLISMFYITKKKREH